MEFNTKKISLFGRDDVILAELDALTAQIITTQLAGKESDFILQLQLAVYAVSQGLKFNIGKWWQFWKWWQNRKYSPRYLPANLPPSLIFKLSTEIQILMGFDISSNGKKKDSPAEEKPLAATSPVPS